MSTLSEKFIRLKTAIGGNREKTGFEFTFGTPESEVNHIAPPSRMNFRILAELEYALHVSEANENAFSEELNAALEYLQTELQKHGVLTDEACAQAEGILAPMGDLAKSYRLILTGHAHIDMNWMWSYQETVAATLATFRTMCNIMDEYPDFTFSQSQASVYRIVEQYDPELMARMKKYINEGRWQVVATNWVETDKNMPSGESLLRHITYTRHYLREVWGVKDFDVDFVPDTFGHAITVPEIDAFGGVKYMYHCRGNAREELLYRYQAPSGREILCLREANWYNSAITPQMASGLMEVVRLSSGLKVGMVVYGVGDHGGGPTRRDIERALDMRAWPIYPTITFGGLRDYFREAEKIRDKTPVVSEEMNFFAPGCYTTQSRIKRGNRRAEAAFYDTEALAALAEQSTDFRMAKNQMEEAWRDVLFTHFHDILTGSCVQDSREHAMGLFQGAAAVTNTQSEKAMQALAQAIHTAGMPVLADMKPWEKASAVLFDTQSEGAGVGYGIEHFSGVPAAERGSGLLRVFHVFNTLPHARKGIVELTVWDYTGDLRRVHMQDAQGNEVPCQLVDTSLQRYWDHRYFRILAQAEVPALGCATLVLRQREAETYPVYLQSAREQVSRFYDDAVLDNGLIRAVIDGGTGRLKSLTDLRSGEEMIKAGCTAGLSWLDTERRSSNAWNVGRTIREIPVDHCAELTVEEQGALRSRAKAVYQIPGGCRVPSTAEVTYSLEAGSQMLEAALKIDWQEQGGDTVPVLVWKAPAQKLTGRFRYLIPAGSILRGPFANDVPGTAGAAIREDGAALILTSDSKYGFRGDMDSLTLTLINSATYPDPYPERGIHHITLWLGCGADDAQEEQELADAVNHRLLYQPSSVHEGILPACCGLAELVSGSVAVTSVQMESGALLIRGYETAGIAGTGVLRLNVPAESACQTDLSESGRETPVSLKDGVITFPVRGSGIWMLRIKTVK